MQASQSAQPQISEQTDEGFVLVGAEVTPQVRVVNRQVLDGGLSSQEKAYLAQRKARAAAELRDALHFQIKPENVPTIAIVASGGGSRALFSTLGVLKGLARLGIFDATTYICGLSGSTWALGLLYDNFLHNPALGSLACINLTGDQAAERVHEFDFIEEFVKNKIKRETIGRAVPAYIRQKAQNSQPISNTDYYGAAIARTLLGKGESIYAATYNPIMFSTLYPYQNASKPLPIFTAGGVSHKTAPPVWFEVSPFEVGTVFGRGKNGVGVYVPTKFFGNIFKGGMRGAPAPEMPLEYYLGVCGSALNVSVHDIKGYIPLSGLASFLIPVMDVLNPNLRFAYAEVLNPFMGINRVPRAFSEADMLGLFDAGLIFNLPYPPLNPYGVMRKSRQADIVIFIDSSDDNSSNTLVAEGFQSWPDGTTLRSVEAYAHEQGMPFPQIPRKGEVRNEPGRQTMSIYREPGAPLVIYYPVSRSLNELRDSDMRARILPSVASDNNIPELVQKMEETDFTEAYKTIHTALSNDQAKVLMAIMEYNVLRNENRIKAAIKDYMVPENIVKAEVAIDIKIKWLKQDPLLIKTLTLDNANEIIRHLDPRVPAFKDLEAAHTKIRQLLSNPGSRFIQSEIRVGHELEVIP